MKMYTYFICNVLNIVGVVTKKGDYDGNEGNLFPLGGESRKTLRDGLKKDTDVVSRGVDDIYNNAVNMYMGVVCE